MLLGRLRASFGPSERLDMCYLFWICKVRIKTALESVDQRLIRVLTLDNMDEKLRYLGSNVYIHIQNSR